MTYKELLRHLLFLSPEQLMCDVTVEGGMYGCPQDECIPAELRICSDTHYCLDENHPVIFIPD